MWKKKIENGSQRISCSRAHMILIWHGGVESLAIVSSWRVSDLIIFHFESNPVVPQQEERTVGRWVPRFRALSLVAVDPT